MSRELDKAACSVLSWHYINKVSEKGCKSFYASTKTFICPVIQSDPIWSKAVQSGPNQASKLLCVDPNSSAPTPKNQCLYFIFLNLKLENLNIYAKLNFLNKTRMGSVVRISFKYKG